jgi:hypothetical protein
MVSGFASLVKETPARACARRHTGVGIGAYQQREHAGAGRASFEAILTSPGRETAFIFRMTFARCVFTVRLLHGSRRVH